MNDSRVLVGGGWPEMVMAKEVDELARKIAGKKIHAIEAFSWALVAITTTIKISRGGFLQIPYYVEVYVFFLKCQVPLWEQHYHQRVVSTSIRMNKVKESICHFD
ncbi:GroEL-like equatorial domain protein [Raphanus sativus]|nr:GroEL-like equatorial domain protein [Raphanus sativus]